MPLDEYLSQIDVNSIPAYVWYILLIVGLLLCFFGEFIWEFMVGMIGALIGSMIGFALGYAMGGYICAFGLMIVCAMIGSMLFRFIAKVAVALLIGLLAFGGVAYIAWVSGATPAASITIGLVVGIIIFIIAVIFVEEIIGVFLAAIGGFLIGVAVYFLAGGKDSELALSYAGLAGGGLFVLGAFFQVMVQRQRKRPRRRAPARKEPEKREPVKEKPSEETSFEEKPPSAQEPETPI